MKMLFKGKKQGRDSTFRSFSHLAEIFIFLKRSSTSSLQYTQKVGSVFHIEFFIDIVHMSLYGAQRNEKILSDLPVTVTLANEYDMLHVHGNPASIVAGEISSGKHKCRTDFVSSTLKRVTPLKVVLF